MKTYEAVIKKNGEVHLNEPVQLSHSCRAILTIVEDDEVSETALLSQESLSQDWERPEEDEAWTHLQ